MRKRIILGVVLGLSLLATGIVQAQEFRFVLIPKVVHPWFDIVNDGAQEAAEMLGKNTVDKFVVDYRAPQSADVVTQNEILERAIATRPDGIIIDPLDPPGAYAILEEAHQRGIAIMVFASTAPEGPVKFPATNNDFYIQGGAASERLAEMLNYEGEVAIMNGVPTADAHAHRAEAHRRVFAKYPKMKVVAEGIDNDDIETAQREAAAIISAHPNLKGIVPCNAAGPIGIGIAVKEANKVGDIKVVGIDDLNQTLDLIKEGVIDSTYVTKPRTLGFWSVVTLWLNKKGIIYMPKTVDTGSERVTLEMINAGYKGF
jgi:ABC-type sugar transport system, periplasmic component